MIFTLYSPHLKVEREELGGNFIKSTFADNSDNRFTLSSMQEWINANKANPKKQRRKTIRGVQKSVLHAGSYRTEKKSEIFLIPVGKELTI